MFGISYLKAPPTTHVIHYKSGKVVAEGAGLSFFYFAPTSEIALVPLASTDAPFVFNEITADFQEATIQGELTYRIRDPKKTAQSLNFSVDEKRNYRSDDPDKLADRLANAAQQFARGFTLKRTLREVLISSDALGVELLGNLQQAAVCELLGVEILSLTVLSIKPSPEMAKALQAEAREELLRKADEAIYARRNNSVLLERTIKENELSTEIAVEQKRRTVRETQMEADIAVEQQRAVLVDSRTQNQQKEADAQAYTLRVTLEPLKSIDWKVLLAANGGGDAKLNIALAFRELAENAQKIGELNVSPDLLNTLLNSER